MNKKIFDDDEDEKIREAVYLILNQLDEDRSGHLTFEEFQKWHKITNASEKDVKELFEKIDTSNDGFITSDELLVFFKKIIVRDPTPIKKSTSVVYSSSTLTRRQTTIVTKTVVKKNKKIKQYKKLKQMPYDEEIEVKIRDDD